MWPKQSPELIKNSCLKIAEISINVHGDCRQCTRGVKGHKKTTMIQCQEEMCKVKDPSLNLLRLSVQPRGHSGQTLLSHHCLTYLRCFYTRDSIITLK